MKTDLRKFYLQKRALISSKRRRLAANALFHQKEFFKSFDKVTSFVSFRGEIDTALLNSWLEKQGKLVLPKVSGLSLRFFSVTDTKKQLSLSSFHILEPIENLVEEVVLTENTCILVPALVFDKRGHRLGYGFGFYDRFFSSHSNLSHRIGIGFKEQLHPTPLPIEKEDVPLSTLKLF